MRGSGAQGIPIAAADLSSPHQSGQGQVQLLFLREPCTLCARRFLTLCHPSMFVLRASNFLFGRLRPHFSSDILQFQTLTASVKILTILNQLLSSYTFPLERVGCCGHRLHVDIIQCRISTRTDLREQQDT